MTLQNLDMEIGILTRLFYGLSPAAIVGSNPTRGMNVRLL
jgi:hypothetical protein